MNNHSTLKIKKLYPDATLPKRGTSKSAGLDLYAYLSEPLLLKPLERTLVKTGVAISLPESTVGLVYARSGLAIKSGITLSNCVGVIDEDYTGEICVGLINLSNDDYTINPNERIAQLVVTPILYSALEAVENLDETARGAGGFGSTGI